MVIYTVKKGDTVYRIAETYGVTPEQIVADNGLKDPGSLVVGQALVIQQPLVSYRVRPGDTAYSVSQQFGLSLGQLYRNNPILGGRPELMPGRGLTILLPKPKYDREIQTCGYIYPNIDRDTLRRTLPYLTYLIVFTYGIEDDGELTEVEEDEELVELARQYGVAPLMQISTLTEEGTFSSQNAERILSDPDLADQVIDEVLEELREKRYSGVDVDFEYLPGQYAEAYAAFIQKLRAALAPEGYSVFVALAPKTRADQPGLLYEGHDYASLGAAADRALVMTYEWGYSRGEPQAVSPLNKVREVIDYSVTAIPPAKLLLGMPNYGYNWPLPYMAGETIATSLSNEAAVSLAREKQAEILFDTTAQAPFFRYYDKQNGRPQEHIVWFEDAQSVAAMLKVVADYGLAGFSVWNIMRFFPSLWTVLNNTFRIRRGLV